MRRITAVILFILIVSSMFCGCKQNVVEPSANVPVVSESPAIASPDMSPDTGTISPEVSAEVSPLASPVVS